MAEKFPVGQAPWETGGAPKEKSAFRVGQAPWDQPQAAPAPSAPPADPNSGAEATLEGFGQGGTFGYLPNLQARLAQMGNAVLPESMGGGGDESYEDLKKAFQRRDLALKSAHPIASVAGNVGGAVMSAPAGGMLIKGAGAAMKGAQAMRAAGEAAPLVGELLDAPAALLPGAAGTAAPGVASVAQPVSTLAKVGKAAATGAGYGAIENPEMEADPNDPYGELKARLSNAALGGITGGVTEGVLSGVSNRLAKAGQRYSDKAVVKQIGANAGQIKQILKKDEIPKIGNFLEDNGLMGVGTSLDDVAEKSGDILKTDGPKIGKLYDEAQQVSNIIATRGGPDAKAVAVSGPALADQIMASVTSDVKAHPDRNLVTKTISDALEPLRDMGENANIKDLHDFRKGLDENINWTQASKERDAIQRAYVKARDMVSRTTQDTIDRLDNAVSGSAPAAGVLDKLKALNQRFSTASTVNTIAQQGVGRETAKAFMGHGVIGGGAGLGAAMLDYQHHGNPLRAAAVGLGTAAAVTGARKFGTPVGYYGGQMVNQLGRAGQAVANNPAMVGAGAASPWANMNMRDQYGR